jgi:5'-phosphate synthase pdxT subunit
MSQELKESPSSLRIGVLALQGDFDAHAKMLRRIGVEAVEVRRAADFDPIDGLIIPGGESTTMLKFLTEERLLQPIKEVARSGRPVLGTCAGAILLARQVANPPQASLGLIDIGIIRNAYGRQVNSFIGEAQLSSGEEPLEAVFIRAPVIERAGPNVEVIARTEGAPVLVREADIFAATFHPELTEDERVHRLFLSAVEKFAVMGETLLVSSAT